MSFVLRHNSKRKKLLASKTKPRVASSRTPGIPRTTTTGGQIQIQRHAPVAQVTPRQKEPVNGIISMDQVIADLRILEGQQNESVRKLEMARTSKQRHQGQQFQLESQLDQLKYRNGQRRSEIKRMHELLSQTQRKVLTVRNTASKAGDDLRDFDNKLKMALCVKRKLLVLQRKYDLGHEQFQNKVRQMERAIQNFEMNCATAQTEYETIKTADEANRRYIRAEALSQQKIADEIAAMRSAVAHEEQRLALAEKTASSLKLRQESIEKEASETQARHDTVSGEFETKLRESQLRNDEIDAKFDAANAAVFKVKEATHKYWYSVIGLQKSEGHPTSPPPSESTALPVLDLDRIRDSVQMEERATMEESKASAETAADVKALEGEKGTLEDEYKANGEKQKELYRSISSKKQTVGDRKTANDKLVEQLKSIEIETTEKETKLKDLNETNRKKQKQLDQEIEDLQNTIDQAKTDLSDKQHEIAALVAKIKETESDLNRTKEEHQWKIAELEERAAIARRGSGKSSKWKEKIKQHKKSISDIFKKHPQLGKIEIAYNEDMGSSEQATIVLAPIIEDCKERRKAVKKKLAAAKHANKTSKPALSASASAGEDPAEMKHRPNTKATVHAKENIQAESAMKPRALEDVFVYHDQTAFSDIQDEFEDDGALEKPTMTLTRPSISEPELTQVSSKSVHWRDGKQEDSNDEWATGTTPSNLQAKRNTKQRRPTTKTFGKKPSLPAKPELSPKSEQGSRKSSSSKTSGRSRNSKTSTTESKSSSRSSGDEKRGRSCTPELSKSRSSKSDPTKNHRSSSAGNTGTSLISDPAKNHRSLSAGSKSHRSSIDPAKNGFSSRSTKKTGNKDADADKAHARSRSKEKSTDKRAQSLETKKRSSSSSLTARKKGTSSISSQGARKQGTSINSSLGARKKGTSSSFSLGYRKKDSNGSVPGARKKSSSSNASAGSHKRSSSMTQSSGISSQEKGPNKRRRNMSSLTQMSEEVVFS